MTVSRQPPPSSIDEWWDYFRRRRNEGNVTDVTVYVRSFSPARSGHDHRAAVVESLAASERSGEFDSLDVGLLGPEVCLCDYCEQTYAQWPHRETVKNVKGWSLGSLQSSGFVERDVNSSITGEQFRTIVPPETTVAVRVDDALVGVFPCTGPEKYHGIDEFIQGLEEETVRPVRRRELVDRGSKVPR